jgi:hypothetical protein
MEWPHSQGHYCSASRGGICWSRFWQLAAESCGRHWQLATESCGRHLQLATESCGRHWQLATESCGRHWQLATESCGRHWQLATESCGRHRQLATESCSTLCYQCTGYGDNGDSLANILPAGKTGLWAAGTSSLEVQPREAAGLVFSNESMWQP